MSIRKMLFWTHLVAGCVAGAIVLVMSLTGVLLTYERQILARVERGPFRSDPPSGSAKHLPVEELLGKIREQRGSLPPGASVTLRSDPREPVELSAGRDDTLYIQPYTGQILGKPPAEGWRTFFQKVTAWHRWLGATGEGRTSAKAITGACNLAFLVLIVTGPFLWLPKQWTRRHLGPITWFRGGLSGKARDFNWHNVFGIWLAVPLFFVVLTAVPMSYQWGNNLIYQLTGTEPPAGGRGGPGTPGGEGRGGRGGRGGAEFGAGRPARRNGGEGRGDRASREAAGGQERRAKEEVERPAETEVLAGLNEFWARAESQIRGWRSIAMRVPDNPRRPLVFTIDSGDGGQPQKRATLTLDRDGGAARLETFADLNAGRRIRSWSRFVHTGEAYGTVGQTIAGAASFAGVMLVWTGISLSLRRFAAWRRKRSCIIETELVQASGGD